MEKLHFLKKQTQPIKKKKTPVRYHERHDELTGCTQTVTTFPSGIHWSQAEKHVQSQVCAMKSHNVSHLMTS